MEPKTYRLKNMVLLRAAAEITVLGILISLPFILFFSGVFTKISFISQALLVVAAVVSALILPAYGFITTKVAIDVDGIRTIALFRKQLVQWQAITGLRLRSAFGWRRYVVIAEDQEISFPVWLHEIDELVDQIRRQLPQGGRIMAVSGIKVFAQDRIGMAFQMFKLAIGLLFIILFWMFYASLQTRKHADPSDAWIILGATIIFTLAMLYRSYIIVMMPRVVSTDIGGIVIQSWFKKVELKWDQVKSIALPLFFLPEGIVLKTDQGRFLIGHELDAFDELQDELKTKIPVKEAAHH